MRTHAFRLAALYFLVFALSVIGVLFFVYWASADFVERQTEATLGAEVTGLAEQYAQRGLAASSRSSRPAAPATAATACSIW